MRKPRIGITSQTKTVDAAPCAETLAYAVSHNDVDGVREAGGVPLLLVPIEGDVSVLLDELEGLVLTGGGDVAPGLYGGADGPSVYRVDPERDAFEIALVLAAKERNLPLLAICRGLQIVNVALGGTLIEDIANTLESPLQHRYEGEDAFAATQTITFEPGCRLSILLGQGTLSVNSIHHQVVKRTADGLRPVAWAGDGVIEALESEDDWPLIAVQWHPEHLSSRGDPASKKLYAALIESAIDTWR